MSGERRTNSNASSNPMAPFSTHPPGMRAGDLMATTTELMAATTEVVIGSIEEVPVALSIYWQRAVAFDEQGRVQKRCTGGSQLAWHQKLVKDILGIYHVGVVVHGVEYTFGNNHAPYSRRIGGEVGGVVAHRPGEAGPQNVLRETVEMGWTGMTEDQIEHVASQLASLHYQRNSYHRLQNNCVDFAQEFCRCLGVNGELPSWCHRGTAAARLMGLGTSDAKPYPSYTPVAQKRFGFAAMSTRVPQRSRADTAPPRPDSPTGGDCFGDDFEAGLEMPPDEDPVRDMIVMHCSKELMAQRIFDISPNRTTSSFRDRVESGASASSMASSSSPYDFPNIPEDESQAIKPHTSIPFKICKFDNLSTSSGPSEEHSDVYSESTTATPTSDYSSRHSSEFACLSSSSLSALSGGEDEFPSPPSECHKSPPGWTRESCMDMGHPGVSNDTSEGFPDGPYIRLGSLVSVRVHLPEDDPTMVSFLECTV